MRYWLAAMLVLAWLALCYASWRRCRDTRPAAAGGDTDWLLGYASQSGQAAQLALQCQLHLQQAGCTAALLPLNRIDSAALAGCRRLLLLASTYGEGEAPDNGSHFLSMIKGKSLGHVDYGMLALGDRSYSQFCAFAARLDKALQQAGARPLFDRIEVDRLDQQALAGWQQQLTRLTGLQAAVQPAADWQPCRLLERCHVNAGSAGGEVYHLRLQPPAGWQWQAGDIAVLAPGNSAALLSQWLQAMARDAAAPVSIDGESRALVQWLESRLLPQDKQAMAALAGLDNTALVESLAALPLRDYSIASIPAQGTLDLLVRRTAGDGNYADGLGSGWLCCHAAIGSTIRLQLRSNPAFHAPADDRPLILIGNGTGMAGLRAHLWQRAERGQRQNWLLFGERTPVCDAHFVDELQKLQCEGLLQRLDLVFSRAGQAAGQPRYVQDLLCVAEQSLRDWVNNGAAIYVCGSRQGMAGGVQQALTAILGEQALQQLAEQGRYCRDVY